MTSQADRRGMGIGESSVTVKWSFVLLTVLGVFGWFFLCSLDHEKRITAQETHQKYMITRIEEVKTTVNAIRQDQQNYYLYMGGKSNERTKR